jgi:pimeloyl-ACP methyl ester carboxylesterase
MIIDKNLTLKDKNKKVILYDVFHNNDFTKKPLVIFSHGYKGFKDWGAWDLVGEEFAKNNLFFVKFNFSHNGGTLKNPIDFPDLNAFGNNNYSYELDDLERILTYFKKSNSKNIDLNTIILIGHSRGGGSVLIKASENSLVKSVITWAGVSDFKIRFKENTLGWKDWKEKGVMYVENQRTKQSMPHFFQFYEDFKKNEDRFNIKSAVEKLKIPYLIIHGQKDVGVLPDEGKKLKSWNSTNELKLIESGDHTFSAKHPWKFDFLPKELKEVVLTTINFIKSNVEL